MDYIKIATITKESFVNKIVLYSKNTKAKCIFLLINSILLIITIYINSYNIKYIDNLPSKGYNNKSKSIKDIFKSRQLFIDNETITNDQIRYIRSIDIKSNKSIIIDEKYRKIKFDEKYFIKRKDQYNFSEYRNICNSKTIFTFNKWKVKKRPLISVILPTYNKRDSLVKSLRSIQIQSLKNIEIIIVDDCSTDFNSVFSKMLLQSDPRIRIITHLKNMGVWRSRIDGFLYSKGKYVIHFDPGDLYEDNYVLEDLYNIIEKYHLDSVKMFFRAIYGVKNLGAYKIKINNNINYTQIVNRKDIKKYNSYIMKWAFGIIWNRLVRSDIYTKGLCLLSDTILNFYKNLWEDRWWDRIANEVSNNLLIVKRFGYLYFINSKGEGRIKFKTDISRDRMICEFLQFLYFDYEFIPKKNDKKIIIQKLLSLNKNEKISLKHIKTRFYILDNLLYKLLKDPYVNQEDKKNLNQLLIDSLKRQMHKK